MIKIEVYRLFDKTVCTIDVSHVIDAGRDARTVAWTNLAYTTIPSANVAHDETQVVLDLITTAVGLAEEGAASLGGWSVLT